MDLRFAQANPRRVASKTGEASSKAHERSFSEERSEGAETGGMWPCARQGQRPLAFGSRDLVHIICTLEYAANGKLSVEL